MGNVLLQVYGNQKNCYTFWKGEMKCVNSKFEVNEKKNCHVWKCTAVSNNAETEISMLFKP
jgi:hypothetical protein